MKKAIVGKKVGMTQVFSPDGRLIPVTVIQAGPCTVVQKKTVENDGYAAVQVGFDTIPSTASKSWSTSPSGPFQKGGRGPHPQAARVPL